MSDASHEREPARTGFVAPRLELPRFRLSTSSEQALTAPSFTTRPLSATPPTVTASPTQTYRAAPAHIAVAAPAPASAPAPAPKYAHQAPPAPPAPHTPAPISQFAQAATRVANQTHTASISWERIEPPVAQQSFLQKLSPVHMGVALVVVVMGMIVTAGPVAMKAPAPSRLPALASGGGTVDGVPDQTLARAGSTALAAAAPAAAPAPAADAGPKMIKVGSGEVAADARHGGIPSSAASAGLDPTAVGGGTGDAPVQMNGIPSPSAAEKLGPQTLAMRADDGVTMPTSAERDSHAVDRHNGASDTLPMDELVETPALTPGAAAKQAEERVVVENLTNTIGLPATNEIRAF